LFLEGHRFKREIYPFLELVLGNQSLAIGRHQSNLLGNKEKMRNCAQSVPKDIEIHRNLEGLEKGRFTGENYYSLHFGLLRRFLHTVEVRGSSPLSPAKLFTERLCYLDSPFADNSRHLDMSKDRPGIQNSRDVSGTGTGQNRQICPFWPALA
jgi:hypothetical protein